MTICELQTLRSEPKRLHYFARSAGVVRVGRNDRFRRFLERTLPWFDKDEYERQRYAAARQIEMSNRAVALTRRQLAEVRRVEHHIQSHR